MKTKIFVISAILLVIFVCGCTGQPAPTDTNVTTPGGDDTSGDTDISEGTEVCTSPYEGTWKGVISDGGDLEVITYGSNDEVLSDTYNPFIAQYDFEMAIKCDYEMLDDNGANDGWAHTITHVKASHPIFDCANGCTLTDTAIEPSYVFIHKDGLGDLAVSFPNGADIIMVGKQTNGYIQAAPDAKSMDLHIMGGSSNTIGSIYTKQSVQSVETYNCRQVAGPDTICNTHMILPSTAKLTKIG